MIAVDASEDNCQRLNSWVKLRGIEGIDVLHGNILENPISCDADIIWVRGIIHHVPSPGLFIEKLSNLAANKKTLFHLYSYDKNSMREWVVQSARRFLHFSDEDSFRADSPLFSNNARMRARDDLTAPIVNWFSATDLKQMLESAGLCAFQQHPDFSEWKNGFESEEFQPYNILCVSKQNHKGLDVLKEPTRRYSTDVEILGCITDALFDPKTIDARDGWRWSIGLFNTHFDALASGEIQSAILQDFLYLLYLLLSNKVDSESLPDPAATIIKMGISALHGTIDPTVEPPMTDSYLARYLTTNIIRL